MKYISGIVLLILCFCMAGEGYAEVIDIDPPITIKTKIVGQKRLIAGKIVSRDEQGVKVELKRSAESLDIPWTAMPAGLVYNLHNKHFIEDDSYESWVKLGRLMSEMGQGVRFAKLAFEKAVAIDAEVFAEEFDGQEPRVVAKQMWDEKKNRRREVNAGVGNGGQDVDEMKMAPAVPMALRWDALVKTVPEDAIKSLKHEAESTQARLGIKLQLHETKFFLFYTDLKKPEAKRWAGELDRMYVKLAELFDVPKDKNIWRGKALIYVFKREKDFRRCETEIYQIENNPLKNAAGWCFQKGNGDVHVLFYRQADDMQFAKILVHEASHGFLFRYRSRVHVPSCWNEGLADTIADMLLPQGNLLRGRQQRAEAYMKSNGHLGGTFFKAPQIQGFQYGIASKLTQFMISQSKKRYVNFINSLKSGVEWRVALKDYYGVDEQVLVESFGLSFGVQGLKAYDSASE
ncbi:hypothetical protein [Poriferisphaera corsica]|nr:hypothetical protein [Poriferisphaera corsica]